MARRGQSMSAPFNQQEPKMNTSSPAAPVRRLRQRLIDDMTMRRFSPETQRNYTAADIRARAIDRYRGLKGLCCRSSPPKRPPDRAMVRCIRLTPTASPKRSGRAQDQPQTEIPIGHRPGPAGSFLGDFRTPAGARNSSRRRT